MSQNDQLLRYATGEVAEVGDAVLIEHARTPGAVCYIISSDQDLKEWGLEEPGLMISAKPFGLVFWPQSEIVDPVVFVCRKVSSQ